MAQFDVYEVAMYQVQGLQQVVSVWHFQDRDGDPGNSPNFLGNRINAVVVPVWRANLSGGVHISSILVTRIVPHDLWQSSVVVNLDCSIGSEYLLPPICAKIITWRTAKAGRRHRGRTYVPAVSSAETTGASINATATTRLTNIGSAMQGAFGVGGSDAHWQLGVWSRVNGITGGVYSYTGYEPVTGFTIPTYIASMGTRRAGHGL